VIDPDPHCFIFGTGEDAVPVARFARQLDWKVTICAEGSQFSTRDRFVGLANLRIGTLSQCVADLDRAARPLALVMRHDYERDRAALAALLSSKVPYIGLLGPARRSQRMLREICAHDGPSKDRLDCVYGPVGLHLGAETPAEIALSIVSEAQAVLARAGGGFLRERRLGIHQTSRPLLDMEGA
jgi:xanthine/CO dehydrogenase XdhC/CoxF family maturation factor